MGNCISSYNGCFKFCCTNCYSMLLGNISIVGYYGNYQLVISTVQLLFSQMGSAFTTSFGNLATEKDSNRMYHAYRKSCYVMNSLAFICCAGFIACIQDFIYIVFGSNFVLAFPCVIILIFNMLVYLLDIPIISVQNSMGLHLVYASSSSVYGSNKKVPYSTDDKVDNPVSLYAATKKSNELMAHAYSKLYNIPSTGLRFFTVYGPAGRPDMAYFGFTNKLLAGDTIQIFNYGNCKRDFTYVDDIVEGVKRVMQCAPEKVKGEDGLPIPPYRVYNIGNNSPENLLDFVDILQQELIRAGVLPEDYDFEAHKKLVPMQPGDVPVTYADTSALERDFGFKPSTSLREGLRRFAEWYKEFYL